MTTKTMTPYLATAIAEGFCEGEGASEELQIEAWQYLVDTGLAWSLQGSFGRQAKSMLESGIISWPQKDREAMKKIVADRQAAITAPDLGGKA